MHGVFGNRDAVAREIRGQFNPGRDKNVTRLKWVSVARHLWPKSTAAHLAAITGKDERTGKRYLRGTNEPPGAIVAAIVAELFEREGDQVDPRRMGSRSRTSKSGGRVLADCSSSWANRKGR